jgi:hypothetical protein
VKLPTPTLQIEFATALEGARATILRDALRATVNHVDIAALDGELASFVQPESMRKLAAQGLRGESLFPVPLLLKQQPSLIGYYRLLYGYSQKEFYRTATGCSRFRTMERAGRLTAMAAQSLPDLCRAFANAGGSLLTGVEDHLGRDLFHELALLTLGAQYRGANNNKRGAAGIKAVFELIRSIVADSIAAAGDAAIEVKNAAGKRVSILVASDPDIFIRSHLAGNRTRPIVAIEVKAGEDQSNIHNRIGEAEKSHRKAKVDGVTECWTIINVPGADLAKLKQESPTSDRFFQLLELTDPDSDAFAEFRDIVRDLVGLS